MRYFAKITYAKLGQTILPMTAKNPGEAWDKAIAMLREGIDHGSVTGIEFLPECYLP